MPKLMEIYHCSICGNIIEVVHAGYGQLVCCSQPMTQMVEHSRDDEHKEKHVPILIKEEHKRMIKVGDVPHPMDDNHYIMFIEAISHDNVWLKRKYLKPGDEPSLIFSSDGDKMITRELCNIHGLWSKSYD